MAVQTFSINDSYYATLKTHVNRASQPHRPLVLIWIFYNIHSWGGCDFLSINRFFLQCSVLLFRHVPSWIKPIITIFKRNKVVHRYWWIFVAPPGFALNFRICNRKRTLSFQIFVLKKIIFVYFLQSRNARVKRVWNKGNAIQLIVICKAVGSYAIRF